MINKMNNGCNSGYISTKQTADSAEVRHRPICLYLLLDDVTEDLTNHELSDGKLLDQTDSALSEKLYRAWTFRKEEFARHRVLGDGHRQDDRVPGSRRCSRCFGWNELIDSFENLNKRGLKVALVDVEALKQERQQRLSELDDEITNVLGLGPTNDKRQLTHPLD